MTTLLAATKPDDVFPSVALAWAAGSALVLLVVSLLNAVCLVLACAAVRVPGVGYGRALNTVLLCNLTLYGFGVVMAVGLWAGFREEATGSARVSYVFLLSPINFVYLFAALVLAHAVVFAQRLGDRDGPPLGFGRAAAVAVIYLGLSALMTFVLLPTYLYARVKGWL